jgi:hypothetical protein
LKASAKSSMDSWMPMDSMMPPSAGAYNSLETLQKNYNNQ